MKQLLIALAVLTSTYVFAHEHDNTEVTFASTKVTDGIYMLSGVGGFAGGNILVSIGEDGVYLVDDAMPTTLGALEKTLATITKEPINFLVNTHIHGDHIGNNSVMAKKGAHIIAHHTLRKNLVEKGMPTMQGLVEVPKEALPVLTYEKSLSLHFNGDTARVIHLSAAHTDADSVIYLEKANVLHTGDILFNKLFPYIDFGNGGSLDGYIAAQKAMLAIINKDTKIIPGHGPLGTMQDLKEHVEMLEFGKAEISKLVKKGLTKEKIIEKAPLKKYESMSWQFITTEKMIGQIYESLTQ